jgi:hypothetical protein
LDRGPARGSHRSLVCEGFVMARQRAECGSEAAYQRHRYDGEAPCADCRRAHSDLNLAAQKRRVAEKREADRLARQAGRITHRRSSSWEVGPPGGSDY